MDPKTRPPLEGERFQVIVIGGGINGAAIARECARAASGRFWSSSMILLLGRPADPRDHSWRIALSGAC